MPQAASLADAIKSSFGINCQLIKGGGGVFDVVVDGNLVYSKDETGVFPDNEQLLGKIGAMIG